MQKITVFLGSARKKTTFAAVQHLERAMQRLGDFAMEMVFLDGCTLEFCQGCKLCFDRGEEFCPLQDDRDLLLEKLEQADAVVFATPSYAFQVPARMKNLLDRCAFLYHRPRFFGKVFSVIITQGVFGGGKIRTYLQNAGANMGFCVTKGSVVQTLEPMSPQRTQEMAVHMEKLAKRLHRALRKEAFPAPSLFRLMMFRISRTILRSVSTEFRDYSYYQQKGWFCSDFYYPVSLGWGKKCMGFLFDRIGRIVAKNM